MSRPRRSLSLLSLSALAIVIALASLGPATAATPRAPRWVRHAMHYSGGISNGVREHLAVAQGKTTTTKLATRTTRIASFPAPAVAAAKASVVRAEAGVTDQLLAEARAFNATLTNPATRAAMSSSA